MKRFITRASLICTALAALVAVPYMHADPWNKKTNVTIRGQLEIPGGVVLDSGKYVFRLADSSSNRHIVQVFNDREDRVYATILAIPGYRQQPTGETVITTWETPAGKPPALRAWYYPGDNYGQEFAYPKHRAGEIARLNRATVPTVPSEESRTGESRIAPDPASVEEPLEERVYTDTHSPQADDLASDDTPEAAPASETPEEPALMAQNQPAPAQPPAEEPKTKEPSQPEPSELPQTATHAALFGLLGAASLTAAAALRRMTRRGR